MRGALILVGLLLGGSAMAADKLPVKPAHHAKPAIDIDNTDAASEAVHVVKDGETLGGIAARAKVPRVLIIEANGLKAPYAVRLGQKLKLPRTKHHTIKPGESGFDIAYKYDVPWKAIALANDLDADAPLKPGQKLLIPTVLPAKPSTKPTESAKADKPADAKASPEPTASVSSSKTPEFAWPIEGKILRGYVARGGKSEYHDGIDIDAAEGAAVRATASGKVIYAQEGPKQYGLTVIVLHANKWTSTYSYLSKITTALGDEVKAGERIGLAGHTGLAKTNELHFELRQNRVASDPVKKLPKL